MNILQKLLIAILVVIPCIFLVTCCWVGNIFPLLLGEKIWLHKNPDVMEKEILHRLPVGRSDRQSSNRLPRLSSKIC